MYLHSSDRVLVTDLVTVLKRLHDEDEGNESGESFLRETSNIPHEGASVSSNQYDHDYACPEADPNTEGQKVYTHWAVGGEKAKQKMHFK